MDTNPTSACLTRDVAISGRKARAAGMQIKSVQAGLRKHSANDHDASGTPPDSPSVRNLDWLTASRSVRRPGRLTPPAVASDAVIRLSHDPRPSALRRIELAIRMHHPLIRSRDPGQTR